MTDEVLGCGCQGTVVVGNFGNRMVAVKRSELKDQLVTEARFLTLCQRRLGVSQASSFWQTTSQCQEPPCSSQFEGRAQRHQDGKRPAGTVRSSEAGRFWRRLQGANGRLFETAGSLKCCAPEMIELANEGYCRRCVGCWRGVP